MGESNLDNIERTFSKGTNQDKFPEHERAFCRNMSKNNDQLPCWINNSCSLNNATSTAPSRLKDEPVNCEPQQVKTKQGFLSWLWSKYEKIAPSLADLPYE